MRIGITYNLKDELSPASVLSSEYNEEFDTEKTIDAISSVFEKNGFEAVRLGGDIEIIDQIREQKIDFVFNIAEGYYGRNRESHVPSILEILNIPYSGSDPLTLGLTLDKSVTKKVAQSARIPTPNYSIVNKIEDLPEVENKLQYPMMIKPTWEGSSKGIYDSSRVFGKKELQKGVKNLLKKYPNQPILVEEYIKGKEITVGVIGNNPPQILGLMEIANKINPGEDIFYSLETKRDWKNRVKYVVPPRISQLLNEQIRRFAIVAFKEFGCRDIARIDFRISEYSKVFLLEINPLPGLSPEYADLVIMAKKAGMDYEKLILTILEHAFSRHGLVKEKYNKLNKTF